MKFMIHAEDLTKSYRGTRVLDRFTLYVAPGTVCGLLGPNGAGKTTALRILATLIQADSGSARIAGFDLATESDRVRSVMGFVGQSPAIDESLTGRHNLTMFARLSHLRRAQARNRSEELLAWFGLAAVADRAASGYSGGMRRRLDLAVGLILAPQLLFLDEPTTGLDPRARSEVWQDIGALVETGTTVLLTTQYLDEEDHLAGQISVLEDGLILAEGSPRALKDQVGGDRVEVVVRNGEDIGLAAQVMKAGSRSEPVVIPGLRRVAAAAPDRHRTLEAVMREFARAEIEIDDVALRQPSLDDVFMSLTGKNGG